jgi:hypothetical protein
LVISVPSALKPAGIEAMRSSDGIGSGAIAQPGTAEPIP